MQTDVDRTVFMDKTVLLVDDEPQGRDLLIRFLQMLGFKEVVAYPSGEQALDYLMSNVPHLILLDYRLPGMSGISVLRAIREKYPKVPVIMITAYTTQDVAIKAIEEGALDLVSKPLNLRELEKQMIRGLSH